MPFVCVIKHPNYEAGADVHKILEEACKEAWASMGEGYAREDVGGAVVPDNEPRQVRTQDALTMLFIYTATPERDGEFKIKLYNALRSRLLMLPPLNWPRILLLPTPPGCWFADPTWAITQKPYTAPHAGSEHYE